jgi:putative glutamine amidotransferase
MYDKTYKVNSFHTNKITKVGKDFDVIATTVDGDVEAFKHKTKPIWGIVWHPERMQEAILPNDLERLLNAN